MAELLRGRLCFAFFVEDRGDGLAGGVGYESPRFDRSIIAAELSPA
jgi:hypothetical protein